LELEVYGVVWTRGIAPPRLLLVGGECAGVRCGGGGCASGSEPCGLLLFGVLRQLMLARRRLTSAWGVGLRVMAWGSGDRIQGTGFGV